MNNLVNSSTLTSPLTLEGFIVPEESRAPLFIITFFIYIIIFVENVIILFVIISHRSLHAPMYLMLCNMTVCDLIGSTALMPRLMSDFLRDVRLISFEACIIQAFCIHMYSTTAQFILVVMAFDRYIAICRPLRYNAIMTTKTTAKLCSLAWGGAFVLIVILLALTIRLPRCKSLVVHAYCFNGALFVLSCADTTINNIYGLFVSYFITGLSLSVMAWTYAKILIACLFQSQHNCKTKAIHTCATHLVSYIVFEITILFAVMALRFPNITPNATKAMGTLTITIPPCLNPVIYGINTKEIRNNILKIFKNKIMSNNK
ncbi:olfactory receptor 52E4-like [Erpetoichthys calabaricus]|uniref:olfactory receptor 52E4-like n=1 Tax=Erpetoichthys calabaricus TaxID=27687 RepID=UPI00109F2AD7|nr:olfactory receptor 52E4-like [Erpetoichthys calabaricus]